MLTENGRYFGRLQRRGFGSGDKYKVPAADQLRRKASVSLTDNPAGPVPLNRASDLFGSGNTDAKTALAPFCAIGYQSRMHKASALSVDPAEVMILL